uniref:Uncharacterized protein n=1 Tax=Tetraselmis sp. GSL018 TaxID=582737 RepID=A0A061S352_9CHLO|mmetsp:Transcript_20332/g.48435  ORF Transcript_20332/g.48435 Transcript_20332/m.48435 type:complete len:127 (+) Transcript_20332:177-557(+)|eukprot:CAMPEP_0177608070 /NCGR_PEP_ID=MMETSP0419_2-20121207/18265_1 /TAXON_ID=582737 /ORGANISM="Tetraselmis sp., Strain GSL018" /LENGTH=126 /DNA_ID=CAMNT_0019102715 /DNA_START=122 /DNA_END=502 /DNA_ORIENTATION=-
MSAELSNIVELAKKGLTEDLKKALEAGADANQLDVYGQTALMCMAQQAELDMVKLLLSKGADPFLTSSAPGRKGMTAMDYAFMEQDMAAADLRGKRMNYAKIIRLLEPPEEDIVEDGANENNYRRE